MAELDRITQLLRNRVPSFNEVGTAALQTATGRTTFGEAMNAQRATQLAEGNQLLDVFKTKKAIEQTERSLTLQENEQIYKRTMDMAALAAKQGEREAEWVTSALDYYKDAPMNQKGAFASRLSESLQTQQPTSLAGVHSIAGKIASEMGLRKPPKIKTREVKVGDQIRTEYYDEDTSEILQTEMAPRHKPAGTTIINAGEKEEQKGFGKDRVKRYQEARDAAYAAQDIIIAVDRMEQLMQAGLETGSARPWLSSAVAFVGDIADLVGMERPEVGGIDPDKSQEWNSYVNRLTVEWTAKLKGALSNKELDYLAGIVPSLGNSAEANNKIMLAMRRGANRAIRYFDMMDTYKINNGGSTKGFDRIWLRYRRDNPLDFSGRIEEDVLDYSNQMGGETPGPVQEVLPTGDTDFGEGDTATNPETGERLQYRAGQWVPLNE